MLKLQYSPSEYIAYLRMSGRRHLLVEGRDDVIVFKLLFENCVEQQGGLNCLEKIDIDSAEVLVKVEDKRSNRDKVEYICSQVKNTNLREKFVGFIDREFRGFEIGGIIKDLMASHKVADRLVWSKGHSVENYFLECEILIKSLRSLSVTTYLTQAVQLFRQVYEPAIRLACAVSLVGRELDRISLLQGAINWSVINLLQSGVEINIDNWRQVIMRQSGVSSDDAARIIERLIFWLSIVDKTEFDTIRWLCHGHIGLRCAWAIYARCVYEVSKAAEDASRVLRADEAIRFTVAANYWVQAIIDDKSEYPAEVLDLLNVSLKQS